METSENEYKLIYTGIFSSLYFTQGVTQSIFTVIVPVYLLSQLGSVDTAALSFMFSIILTPFILKLIYGLLNFWTANNMSISQKKKLKESI